MNRRSFSILVGALTLALSAGALHATSARADDFDDDTAGAVYTMTNAPDHNAIVIFARDEQGALGVVGTAPTGGVGSGGGLDPLASQGSLRLTDDRRWLLAANAGSNDISVFRVRRHGLELVDAIPSGGVFPTSIAIAHDLVYVLNAGGTPNISGFTLDHQGHLAAIAGSTRTLGPGIYSQVGFDPDGNTLVLTHRSSNELLVYPVSERGRPAATPIVSPSHGAGPFSFAWSPHGRLLVAEAGTNAVSAYALKADGTLRLVTPSVPNGQTATCWIATAGPRYVFTANPGTASISSYRQQPGSGDLTLVAGVAGTGARPLDLAATDDKRFLYALDPAAGAIDAFRIRSDGTLVNLGATPAALPLFAQGIAVR